MLLPPSKPGPSVEAGQTLLKYAQSTRAQFTVSEKRVFEYLVPSNWQELLAEQDPNWGKFPDFLYPFDNEGNNTREIRINYRYLQDYHDPVLRIWCSIMSSTTSPADPDIHLVIFKGGNEVFVDEKLIEDGPFFYYDFYMGGIKKDLHDKNEIIIRCSSPNKNLFLMFDYIHLFVRDKDTDGDGVSDVEEGEDYAQNQSIASIPITNYDPDPWNIIEEKRITLNCESGEASPCFRQAGFIDPNSLNVPEWLMADRFLPYGFLEFRIEEMKPQAHVLLKLNTTDPIYSSLQCHTYQDANGWQEVNCELIDEYTIKLLLRDGGPEDGDGNEGSIYVIMCLSYPKELDTELEQGSCFMGGIGW